MRNSDSSRTRQNTLVGLKNGSSRLVETQLGNATHVRLAGSNQFQSRRLPPLSAHANTAAVRPLSDMPANRDRKHVQRILSARQDLTDLEEELFYTQQDIGRIRDQRRARGKDVQAHPEDHLTKHNTAAMSRPGKTPQKQQVQQDQSTTWGTGRHLSQFNDDILHQKILNRQNGTPDPDNERGGYQIAEGVQTNDELHIPLNNQYQTRSSTTTPRQDNQQLLPAVVDGQQQRMTAQNRRQQQERAPSLGEIIGSIVDHDFRRPSPPPYAIEPRVVHGRVDPPLGYRAHGHSSMHSDTDTPFYFVDSSDAEDRSGIRNSMKNEDNQLHTERYKDQSIYPKMQSVQYDNNRRIRLDSERSSSRATQGYREPQRFQGEQAPLRKQWMERSYGPASVPLPHRQTSRAFTDSDDDINEVSQRILRRTENSQARLFQRALERRYGNEPERPEQQRWKNTSPTGAAPELQRESDEVMLRELEQQRHRRLVEDMHSKYGEDIEHESRFHFEQPGEFYQKPRLPESFKQSEPHYTYRTQSEIMHNPVLRDEYVKGFNRQVKGQSDTRQWGIRRFSTTTRGSPNNPRQKPVKPEQQQERVRHEDVPQENERSPSDPSAAVTSSGPARARGQLHHESVYTGHQPYEFVPVEETLSGRSNDSHRSGDPFNPRGDLH